MFIRPGFEKFEMYKPTPRLRVLMAVKRYTLHTLHSEYTQEGPRQVIELHRAVHFVLNGVAQTLLNSWPSPDSKDSYGRTPLSSPGGKAEVSLNGFSKSILLYESVRNVAVHK